MTRAEPRPFPTVQSDRLVLDPLFAELRAGGGELARVRMAYGEPAWLATRYDDVKTVLSDPRFSRAAAVGRDEPRVRPRSQSRAGSILSMDPPEHGRLRRLVTNAFTVKRIEQMRPRVREIANGLVDTMLANGSPGDLVDGFAMPLPVIVICELLGVPYEDRSNFRMWSDALLSTTKYTEEQVNDYMVQLGGYLFGLLAERRQARRDDLLSVLIAARDDNDRLSDEQMVSLAMAILVAGHETTVTQIPNFMYVLLTHPTQLAQLRADPTLVPRAVEELMRFVPLGGGTLFARYAVEDVDLGGVTVRAGEPVLAAISAANYDESVYRHPEVLDLTRTEASHVGFGHGAHHCLGAPLARMELQVALETLIGRLPGIRLADGEASVEWKEGMSTRGPQRLVVAWD